MSHVWTCKCEGKVHIPEEQSLVWSRGRCEPPRGPIESHEFRREPCKGEQSGLKTQAHNDSKNDHVHGNTDPGRRPGSRLLELIAHARHLCVSSLSRALWSFWSWNTGQQRKAGLCILCPQPAGQQPRAWGELPCRPLREFFDSYWYSGIDLDVQFSLHHGCSNCP